MVPDPLPLAYAVYAFINVDNCERPLMEMVEMLFDFGLTERSLLDSLSRRLCCHVVMVHHLRPHKYAPYGAIYHVDMPLLDKVHCA